MNSAATLPKYSLGVGDRFAHQAKAQLQACVEAAQQGVEVIPVWNKSNREHTIIGSHPSDTRSAADQAVKALNWREPYFLDADHINLQTVERFIEPCDFFTIDVADSIGKPASEVSLREFADRHPELAGEVPIRGIELPLRLRPDLVMQVAQKYLCAVQEAGRIYRHIERQKGRGRFIPEVSLDETDSPQTPVELLVILAAIADEAIPIQTIAPKFTGRFNKGVDYAGDLAKFAQEFKDDLAVIVFAIRQYELPVNLKLSVHSGSDKFSIYRPMRQALKAFAAGVHLKTAGTTWLEELIGLAEAGGSGLDLAKEIYREAYAHREELCAPYSNVIDIDPAKLPNPEEVNHWTPEHFVSALRHDPASPAYNASMRQLLHVGFKIAAKMGSRYLDLLSANEGIVAKNVTENLYGRHIRPLFLGD
ncbi:MAG: tagaturonate epimerase family protein [Acidobacteriota bacterium]|nr:tagaturonate epimerase family protein [Acidobacteriota bacterium]